MKLGTALLAVTFGLLASQQAIAQGPTAAEAAANRQRPFLEGQEALTRFIDGGHCGGADSEFVKAKLADLQEDVSLFQTAGMSAYAATAREMHTTLAFGYADAALKMKCLDDADGIYRGLVIFYTGNAWSGIRDRARIGIDDVRALR